MLFVFSQYCFRGLFFTISWYVYNKMLLFPQVFYSTANQGNNTMFVLSYHRLQKQHYFSKHHIAALA